MSELQKRPLYRVTAGDLDLSSYKLESKLSQILDLATRWKAIVLLDEAGKGARNSREFPSYG